MRKLSVKIIFTILFCIMLVAVSIGMFSLNQASVILSEESYNKFEYISKSYANEFSILLTGTENIVHTIVSDVKSSFDLDMFVSNEACQKKTMDKLNSMIKQIGEETPYIQGIYLALNPELTGKVYESWYIYESPSNFVYQEAEDISEFYEENKDMAWYYDPIRMGKGTWSLPYTDATINIKMISYTEPIYVQGTLVGVAGIDISFADLLEKLKDMNLYERGYASLLDENYNIIFHPEIPEGMDIKEIKNENFDELILASINQDSGVHPYIYKGENKLLGFSRLSNNWIFLAIAEVAEVNKPVDQLSKGILTSVVMIVVLSTLIGLRMSKSITDPLDKLHLYTENIGNGNYDIDISWIKNDEIGNLAKSFHDMTKKIELSQSELRTLTNDMEFMAFHDTLTHLPNRRCGHETLEDLLLNYDRSSDFSGIMSIDLDNFKTINDTMGHDAGDEILLHAADMMSHCINHKDMLCRFGGDEFILIFKEIPHHELISKLALRLLNAISSPVMIGTSKVSVTCSIGIAVIDDSNMDLCQILKEADLAMYNAKASGGDSFSFYESHMN